MSEKPQKSASLDYSKTLFLPQTDFPMRAGLPQREPEILIFWYDTGLYEQLRVRALGNWTIAIRPGVEKVATPIRFSGSGAQQLPPFRIRSAKTIHWTNSGTRFQVYPSCRSGTNGVISSAGHRGSMHLPAGRYQLYVNAAPPEEHTGTWSIVIR